MLAEAMASPPVAKKVSAPRPTFTGVGARKSQDIRPREAKAVSATTLTFEEIEEARLAKSVRGGKYELSPDTQCTEMAPWPAGLGEEHRVELPYEPATVEWNPDAEAPKFYNWKEVYPFLQPVRDNIGTIIEEVKAATRWHAWPEQALYNADAGDDWKVFPFCHTFPATDSKATTWLPRHVAECPRTAGLLASIPGLRTALVSRLGPGTSLTAHRGWAALANHVLRIHLPLVVPRIEEDDEPCCGLACESVVQHHKEGEFLVFDDSKLHMAFNDHPTASRVVLIFDIMRPAGLPLGLAEGDTTEELSAFIEYFNS